MRNKTGEAVHHPARKNATLKKTKRPKIQKYKNIYNTGEAFHQSERESANYETLGTVSIVWFVYYGKSNIGFWIEYL